MTTRQLPKALGRIAALLAPSLLIVASAAAPTAAEKAAATKGMVKRADLEIVDCLLPGQVRQLGNSSFLSQRRPIRTTAVRVLDSRRRICRLRSRRSAVRAADLDAGRRRSAIVEAQTNVGEIYERGMGVAPNYEAAAMWYQKAADKNYSRALFNLGTMYEQGLGVPQDGLKALESCIDRPGACRKTTSSSRRPRSASRMSCARSSMRRLPRKTRNSVCCKNS